MKTRRSFGLLAILVLGLGDGATRARGEDPAGPLRVVVHVNFS